MTLSSDPTKRRQHASKEAAANDHQVPQKDILEEVRQIKATSAREAEGDAAQPAQTDSDNPATRMFAAWSGQDPDRVGRDPKALLDGLRAVGGDIRGILGDAMSGDPARHARAEAWIAELKRLQAEAGLSDETSSDPEPEPATEASCKKEDESAGERFRDSLNTILKEAVGRLEDLKKEVDASASSPKKPSPVEAGVWKKGKGKKRF